MVSPGEAAARAAVRPALVETVLLVTGTVAANAEAGVRVETIWAVIRALNVAANVLTDAEQEALDGFLSIDDPVRRAAAITAYGRPIGSLKPPFRAARDAAISESHGDGERVVKWLAGRVGISRSRMSRILARTRTLATASPEGAQP